MCELRQNAFMAACLGRSGRPRGGGGVFWSAWRVSREPGRSGGGLGARLGGAWVVSGEPGCPGGAWRASWGAWEPVDVLGNLDGIWGASGALGLAWRCPGELVGSEFRPRMGQRRSEG